MKWPSPLLPFLALFALGSTSFASAQQPSAESPASAGFFHRWADYYHRDWTGTQPAGPAPLRRGLPSPLDAPPFPAADWSYGGSPVLGEPDTGSYPLMTALGRGSSRTKVYGWIAPSVNLSTSHGVNLPEANDYIANTVQLSQIVVYAERLPDTVQRDHMDWGFHLTSLFGTDYHFTAAKGWLSSRLIDHNERYGFDPTLEYVDLYLPRVGQGMNLRVGRFISVPGIEAQLAPNNYTLSHSLLYSIDPFTDTGVMATIKLSDQWLVQLGLTAGHDVAPWTSDAKPSGTACVDYTTRSVNDNLYLCANGINSGRYAYDNSQQFDATWYHRFSRRIHSATESWFMYQRGVPAVGGPIAPESNTSAAVCAPGLVRCLAPEYAVVGFLNGEIDAHNSLSLRASFLNDKKGQRTGYQTRYNEETLSWSHWWGTTVQLRPELRYDRAWDRPAYDNGKHQGQFTAASDLIFHF